MVLLFFIFFYYYKAFFDLADIYKYKGNLFVFFLKKL